MSLRHSYICIRWTLHQFVAIIKFGEIASRSRALVICVCCDSIKLICWCAKIDSSSFDPRSVSIRKRTFSDRVQVTKYRIDRDWEKFGKIVRKCRRRRKNKKTFPSIYPIRSSHNQCNPMGHSILSLLTNSSMTIAIGFVCLIKFIWRKPHNPNVGFCVRPPSILQSRLVQCKHQTTALISGSVAIRSKIMLSTFFGLSSRRVVCRSKRPIDKLKRSFRLCRHTHADNVRVAFGMRQMYNLCNGNPTQSLSFQRFSISFNYFVWLARLKLSICGGNTWISVFDIRMGASSSLNRHSERIDNYQNARNECSRLYQWMDSFSCATRNRKSMRIERNDDGPLRDEVLTFSMINF